MKKMLIFSIAILLFLTMIVPDIIIRTDQPQRGQIIFSDPKGSESSTDLSDIINGKVEIDNMPGFTQKSRSPTRSVLLDIFDYVNGWTMITNATILQNHNITINKTGSLVLKNTTLIFNTTQEQSYGIIIEQGGIFETRDGDDDLFTTDDYSVIRTNQSRVGSTKPLFIHAKKGSRIILNRTLIQLGGLNTSINKSVGFGTPRGILIESDHSRIGQCMFSNSTQGLFYNGTDDSYSNSVDFRDIKGTSITFNNSKNGHFEEINITGSGIGVKIINSHGVYLNDSIYHSSEIALAIINSSIVNIYLNRINDNFGKGLSLINSRQVNMIESEIINNNRGILIDSSDLMLRYCILKSNYFGIDSFKSEIDSQLLHALENSSVNLYDHSNMLIQEPIPFPGTHSPFWNLFSADATSELHILKLINYYFNVPEATERPTGSNTTLYSSSSEKISEITVGSNLEFIQMEPFRIINGITEWQDPFRIEFIEGGYYLNQTFTIFESETIYFTFDYNNAPSLKNIQVNPDRGFSTESFSFYVEYWDPDGDEPLFVDIFLDNSTYRMKRVSNESNAKTGIGFQLDFDGLEVGQFTLYFETDDGRDFLNSNITYRFDQVLDVLKGEKKESEEGGSDNLFLALTICFAMVFIFVIFMIVANYLMHKKMAKVGGVPPGTLPEDLVGISPKEKIICSECGEEIDADAPNCPKCGEKFEGEEYQCPKCEKVVPDDAKTCPHCGNEFLNLPEKVETDVELKDKAGKKGVIREKISCSECGAVVDDSMTECPGCGEVFDGDIDMNDGSELSSRNAGAGDEDELEDDTGELTYICSVCGASVKESATVCPKCKTELE